MAEAESAGVILLLTADEAVAVSTVLNHTEGDGPRAEAASAVFHALRDIGVRPHIGAMDGGLYWK